MGMFKDARKAAEDAMKKGQSAGAAGMAGMPDMAMPDPAYVAKVNKLGKSGVEAPAVIKAMRAMGGPDMSGATMYQVDVTITPSSGKAYDTTITQSLLAMQMDAYSEGKSVKIKYDPDDPTAALLN